MMRIESLEFGRSISGDPPDVLLRHSKEEYDSLVRRIIRTGLAFREEDLDDDFAKHAPKFGITSRGEYARMARQEVRNASKILAQNHFGELQILFFGERGHVVVDLSMRIRGYYHT